MSNQTAANPAVDSGIVWLASYPKSGNTWTRAFLSNLVTVMAGEEEELDVNSINRFSVGESFTQLYKDLCGFEPKPDDHRKVAENRHRVQEVIADQFEGLIFCKTHNALVIDRGQSIINFAVTSGAIYIVRNPLDVAISLAHHIGRSIDEAISVMATQDAETPIDETRVHEVWGSWSQHVESWTRKPHPAIYVMRYEDMLSDPEKTFGALARHLLLNPTADELALAIKRSSFESLSNHEEKSGFQEKPKHADRFFREGRAGQWKDVLAPKQVDLIVNAHGGTMKRFGYLPLV
jgi:hypothetical protein